MFVYTYCTMFKEPVIKKKRENSRACNREAKSSFRMENSGVDMNWSYRIPKIPDSV